MLEYLEKLRRKPEHVRKNIALGSTSMIFLLIFSMWLTTKQWGSENPRAVSVTEVSAPVQVVFNAFDGFKGETQEMVASLQGDILTAAVANATDTMTQTGERDLETGDTATTSTSEDIFYDESSPPPTDTTPPSTIASSTISNDPTL